jgi:hypothetical protein
MDRIIKRASWRLFRRFLMFSFFTEEDADAFAGCSDALLPVLKARGSLHKVQGNKVRCGNDFK